ncbi:hypothetical protein SmJEL517_g05300 [Synchytrium microbalum]|uniref:Sugar phosphate transporter domain-containing protein n=1 Tax=Synchytrium microbalum TaxID=1806994 RepID=A0A507BW36_9FUNG|nr:uncharacterized protein SmJEL517_g05300 [Synchytrium microbalum]TPX31341.1 hypothetical protein SmJEL517_g05300 [Synchytrium microbalum]
MSRIDKDDKVSLLAEDKDKHYNAEAESSPNMVLFSVLFYMVTSIVMVLVNKAVLNNTKAPLSFLWLQIITAVFLLKASELMGWMKLPPLDMSVCRRLMPLIGVNVVGLAVNTICLQEVDASFYQVARALVLPLTVIFTWTILKKPSSGRVILTCGIVCAGFLTGTLDRSPGAVSLSGIIWGLASSVTTAFHSIVIKSSLDVVKGSTMDLVWYNNILSAVGLIPIVVLGGEVPTLYGLVADASAGSWGIGGLGDADGDTVGTIPTVQKSLSTQGIQVLLWGGFITGIFGFLINIAGFLQIKVTSPVTHMISSAVRGVVQTALAVVIFGDIVTTARGSGIFLILVGSSLYAYVKSEESRTPPASGLNGKSQV